MGRNSVGLWVRGQLSRVALLAEGVGRNNIGRVYDERLKVALLAEGVGRNLAVVPLLSTVITKKISTKEKKG